MKRSSFSIACSLLALCQSALGLTVNADFARDITTQNPGTNPAALLYVGTGPAADSGTVWNDLQVPLSTTGDLTPTPSVDHPVVFSNLSSSTGSATAIDIQLTSNFYRAFNSTGGTVNNLQRDWAFANNNLQATLTIQGLDPARQYELFLIGSTYSTTFTVGGVAKTASGTAFDGVWSPAGEYVSFSAVTPTAGGEIVVLVQGSGQVNGAIAGLQIVTQDAPPVNFLYPNTVTSTGGQFSSSYPPSNLINNAFTSPSNTISTVTDYLPAGNNYASVSGTTQNFNLTFDFATPATLDGMYVWNYAYRNGANGSSSPTFGVNSYTLTFYTGGAGTGTTIGSVFSGSLSVVPWSAANPAESVSFGASYAEVRSVVMRVLSNHGGTTFTGINELAFNGIAATSAITSFIASAPFVQRPATPTLSWQIDGEITSLEIAGIGSVLDNTTNGSGSIPVSPIGEKTYTLTLNGSVQKTATIIGLPPKEKLHIYLLIGQSNMQGEGNDGFNAVLDAPDPRVIKFGSREGMESVFLTGSHRLTHLASNATENGMGVEFGKTLLASESDPEVVICLINHALGSTAIQWWMPDIPDGVTNHVRQYILYNEAIQRVANASSYGVIKGVLWHQGEYNSNNNTSPAPEPALYAGYLNTLVDNLRRDLGNPGLPFICGKLMPGYPFTFTDTDGVKGSVKVEAALAGLPNQRANTFCVDNNGLASNASDQIHFNAPSQRILGQRYGTAMNSFYADPFRLYLGGFYTPTQLASPQITDPAGDNDNDGYSNFLEFAFLTNPSKAETIAPVRYSRVTVPGEGEFPAITFRQRFDTDAPQYVVQVSTDLMTWQNNLANHPPVTATVSSPFSNGDGTYSVTVRSLQSVSTGSGSDFIRVRSTAP